MDSSLLHGLLLVGFGLLGYAYVGYPATLVVLASLSRSVSGFNPSVNFAPSVTMVVAAHNEASVIERKLKNVERTAYEGSFECLVVSDSTDETDTLVERHANPQTRLISLDERRGKSYALNKAIKESDSEVIVLSDANTMYEPDAVSHLVRPLADEGIGCVTGQLRLTDADGRTSESFYWRYELWLRELEASLGSTVSVNGGMLAFRRERFEPLPERALTDDMVVALREAAAGRRVVFARDAIATEYTAGGLWNEYARRVRIGVGNFQTLTRFANLLVPLHGLLSFEFFSHKVLRWCMPFILSLVAATTVLLSVVAPSPLIITALVMQAICYAVAVLGMVSERARANSLVSIPAYFLTMNLAFAVGFWKFVIGADHAIWKSTPRTGNN